MKAYLLATAATLVLSAPALAAGQGQAAGAAGSPQQTQYQSPQNQAQNGMQQRIAASELSESEIRQIQQALNEQGFNAGATDGEWGPQTEQALNEFRSVQNLPQSSEIDQQSLSALGVQVAAMDDMDRPETGTTGAGTTGAGTTGSGTTGSGSSDSAEPAFDASPAPADQPDGMGTQQ
jgi:hypothetical protein